MVSDQSMGLFVHLLIYIYINGVYIPWGYNLSPTDPKNHKKNIDLLSSVPGRPWDRPLAPRKARALLRVDCVTEVVWEFWACEVPSHFFQQIAGFGEIDATFKADGIDIIFQNTLIMMFWVI